jgi:signal peptidase I
MDRAQLAPRGLRLVLLSLLAAGLLLLAVSQVLGWQMLTIMSGSMAPEIRTGDLVVARPAPPGAAAVGDVITFRDPLDATRLITHRVVGVEASPGAYGFETRGDANPASERWSVSATGTVGRTVLVVPAVGRLLHHATSPVGQLLLVVLPALAIGVRTLRSIWSRPAGQREWSVPLSRASSGTSP